MNSFKQLLFDSILLLSVTVLVVWCNHDHVDYDSDQYFHDSQIPPPHKQPSKDEIKAMLEEIFQLVDSNKDSLVEGPELKQWLDQLHQELINENIDQQWAYYGPAEQEVHSWESYDPEKREALDWDHYINSTYSGEVIKVYKEQGPKLDLSKFDSHEDPNFKSFLIMLKRAEKRWKAADLNNDTVLVKNEFKLFIHPEESENTKYILVDEAMEDMDLDNNKEVTLEEYIKHMNEVSSDEEKQDPNFLGNHQSQFQTYLDKNKDSVLNNIELTEWLAPNFDRHEAEALRMIHDTDENSDQKLNLQEILKNDDYFLSLIPGRFWRRYTQDHPETSTPASSHDEF